MQFEGLISSAFLFLSTRNPNLRSISKPEVELLAFLRMRSNKITKNGKNALKMQVEGLVSRMYILKPKVEFMVFLRMRSNKITKSD